MHGSLNLAEDTQDPAIVEAALERGRRVGDIQLYRRLAVAMSLNIEDIAPLAE